MNPFHVLITNKVGSFVRTAVAGAAGFLVAKGVLSPENVESVIEGLSSAATEIAGGAILYAIAQVSSLINKKGQ